MSVVIDVAERWRFAGQDLSTFAQLVTRVEGANELPAVVGEDVPVAAIDGRHWSEKRFDSRRVALSLFVGAATAAGTDPDPDMGESGAGFAQANLEALHKILAPRSLGSLVQIMPDGSERTALAECLQFHDYEDFGGRQALGGVADFSLPDPWFYGEDVVSDPIAIAASPTDYTLTHPGTVRGPRVVFDFEGPISNPRITNLQDPLKPIYVECLVAVAAGEHLVIDCARWTAFNDATGITGDPDNAIGSVRHSGALQWMLLQPGDNSLEITADAPGGFLTITFRPPFV